MNRDARHAMVGIFAVALTMKVNRFPATGETLLGAGYRMDPGRVLAKIRNIGQH